MKKILKVLTMALMVFVLTGCMKLSINVEVKADKTMAMGMEILAEESMFKSAGMSADDYVKQMEDQIKSSEGMEDAKTTPIEKTIDGSKWVGVSVQGTASADASVRIIDKEVNGKDGIELTLPMDDFSDQMDMSQLTSYGYSVEQMKKLGMEMNVVIKMPGKATSNVGTVDGNTVTVDLLDMMATGKSNDIIVSSELSGGGMDMSMIFIIVGVAAIAGVVAFMLMKKKKENHEEVYDGSPISKATEEKVVTEAPVVESDVEEKIEAPTEVVNEEKVELVTEPKAYCPNCGTPVGSEETCPNCGFTLKK